MEIVRYAERPELREQRRGEFDGFPEYMHHNAMGSKYWDRLYGEFPSFQLALVQDDLVVAEVHALTVPVRGDDLPEGWDEAFERGMERGGGNVVSLLAMSVGPAMRRQGVPGMLLDAVREAARAQGLDEIIAPVRPTLKNRYPLIPIERYMTWRREDGAHFDPWLRTHERLGGAIVGAAPRSMFMEAPIEDWRGWLDLELPEDGSYIHPDMLAPLVVENGVGTHVEPNVWVRHSV